VAVLVSRRRPWPGGWFSVRRFAGPQVYSFVSGDIMKFVNPIALLAVLMAAVIFSVITNSVQVVVMGSVFLLVCGVPAWGLWQLAMAPQRYRDRRIARMRAAGCTDADIDSRLAAPGFVDRHLGLLTFATVLGCVVFLPVSLPIFLFCAVRLLYLWFRYQKEDREDATTLTPIDTPSLGSRELFADLTKR
jgi:hypothetical protein